MKRYTFHNWSLEDGLSTVERMIKKREQNGGSPLLWLEAWARDRLLGSTDRTYIEMKGLLSSIYYAGRYDQLTLASVASIEVLCRPSVTDRGSVLGRPDEASGVGRPSPLHGRDRPDGRDRPCSSYRGVPP